jgi:hypothetical protein
MITIDSSVPTPDFEVGKNSGMRKYPFQKMEVGDSIFFENTTHDSNSTQAAKRYFSRNSKTMISRKEKNGIRIWRVS